MSNNQDTQEPKVTGLKFLEATLKNKTEHSRALARVLLAAQKGDLKVNGQIPSNKYKIGEYFIHGGRVRFDLSALTPEQKQEFFLFITNKQATSRAFATHRAGGIDADGSPAETKSGVLGAIADAFRALFGISKHYGINLAIGGTDYPVMSENGLKYPEENGRWGHMYIHKDDDLVMVGIEPSDVGEVNEMTDERHSPVGGSGELSPFMNLKINDPKLIKAQIKDNSHSLSTKEKYNWAVVKITQENFEAMQIDHRHMHDADWSNLGNNLPKNTQTVVDHEDYMKNMEKFNEKTNKLNETSLTAKIFGLTLFVLGIALAFAPIPGLAQFLGGLLAKIGIGVATAGKLTVGAGILAAAVGSGVGLGVISLGSQQAPKVITPSIEENAADSVTVADSVAVIGKELGHSSAPDTNEVIVVAADRIPKNATETVSQTLVLNNEDKKANVEPDPIETNKGGLHP